MSGRISPVCSVFLSAVLILSGCAKKMDAVPPTPQTPSTAQSERPISDSTPAAVLDKALELWRTGQKEQAADIFLQINWETAAVFTQNSVFAVSEGQFKTLPRRRRQELLQKALLESTAVRELTQYLVKQARQPGTDIEKYRRALAACGQRLSANDQLAIIQLVGKAVSEYAKKELLTFHKLKERAFDDR
ncbi:MAG TPA: hypothetical protein P5175_08585 [Anaerohalosphaeraceae bacterium]|nr:hypothetical protein [Anaerohalosphaeraceae bacterium]HPC64439.1 hypothetical protein [Anaerohalosphaeraceae bacterium]HRS71892.1 hypothetical protein [Anaerohalosphaeraceae bacterium]HRV19887.1 hypothetical protein [Anaerohalosphaeraceae bacterium]